MTAYVAYDSLSAYDSFCLPSGLSSSQGLRRACSFQKTVTASLLFSIIQTLTAAMIDYVLVKS